MTDEREARLPKWAQQELARLRAINATVERRVADAHALAETYRLETKPDDSNTTLEAHRHDRVGLGNDTRVRFCPKGDRPGWWDYLDVRVQGDHIELHAGGAITLEAHSSNLMRLRVGR